MNYKQQIIDTISKIDDEQILATIYNNKLSDYHNDDCIIQLYSKWLHNQTNEEMDLMIAISLLEKLFDDMCFYDKSITSDYMLRDEKHKAFKKDLSIDEQHFRIIVKEMEEYVAYTDISDRKIVVSKDQTNNKCAILHEMIHAHEHILEKQKPILKEIVLLELYKDLKPKLAKINIDLDKWILNHANIPHNIDLADTGGEHDILFFLKSIDLDLKCGYEPLTIFGYDYKRNFSLIE